MGEMSVNVSSKPTRSPPIQCSVETSTPSTSARPLSADLPQTRSYPNGMEATRVLSIRLCRHLPPVLQSERKPGPAPRWNVGLPEDTICLHVDAFEAIRV